MSHTMKIKSRHQLMNQVSKKFEKCCHGPQTPETVHVTGDRFLVKTTM